MRLSLLAFGITLTVGILASDVETSSGVVWTTRQLDVSTEIRASEGYIGEDVSSSLDNQDQGEHTVAERTIQTTSS